MPYVVHMTYQYDNKQPQEINKKRMIHISWLHVLQLPTSEGWK